MTSNYRSDRLTGKIVSPLAMKFGSILKHARLKPNTYSDSTTMTDSASSNYEVYEDEHVNCNTLSMEAINGLRCIAVSMNSSGLIDECIKVYVSERKSVVHASLNNLNLEKLSTERCRRLGWQELEPRIKIWIKAAKVCFKYYFVNEKRLFEQIFHDLGNEMTDSYLMDVITDCTIRLFDTVESFSCVRPASERLFKILDLHETMYDLVPEINSLFSLQSSEFIRNKAVNQILPQLADKANEILLKFESALVEHQSPVDHAQPVPSSSRYVMHYVYKFCDRKQALMRLSLPNIKNMDAAETTPGSFSAHVICIIMSLVSNLEAKSNIYKDPPARRFFAMNNFHYIIQNIQMRPELLETIAGDSFNKLVEKYEHARSDYLELTFAVVLKILKDEGPNKIRILSFEVLKLTHRLKRFNVEFEKVQKVIEEVVVHDIGLVMELRGLIIEMVVTPYTSFLVHTKRVGCLEKYVKLRLSLYIFLSGKLGLEFNVIILNKEPQNERYKL